MFQSILSLPDNEPPPKKKKIGKKSKIIKLPTGITSSVLDDIDAELEEAYKQSVARKEKTKSTIKEILSDPSASFALTLDNLGEYAQSEPEHSLSPEYKVDNPEPISYSDPNSKTTKRRSKIDKTKHNEFNSEEMEAVNAMLQSYEQRSKSVDIQRHDKKKGGFRSAQRKKKEMQQNLANRRKRNKKKINMNSNKIKVKAKNIKNIKTPKPKQKRKTKKAAKKQKKERFVNILKMKAESAKKRKKEGTQQQMLDHDNQIFGEEMDDDYEEVNDGDDKFDLVYVPTTQIETQYADDLMQINENDRSLKISLPSTYASNTRSDSSKNVLNDSSVNFDIFDELI